MSVIWGHKEWAPTRKIDPIYDMDRMRQRIDEHADQEADMPLTPADIDAIWAEPQPFPAGFEDVGPAGQAFRLRDYVSGARVEAGRAARQATAAVAQVKAVQTAVTAQGKQIAAVAEQLGKAAAAINAQGTLLATTAAQVAASSTMLSALAANPGGVEEAELARIARDAAEAAVAKAQTSLDDVRFTVHVDVDPAP